MKWYVNKIYFRQHLQCWHSITKDWYWNLSPLAVQRWHSDCAPKKVWVLSSPEHEERKHHCMLICIEMKNRIYHFCHHWGSHLHCISHSSFWYPSLSSQIGLLVIINKKWKNLLLHGQVVLWQTRNVHSVLQAVDPQWKPNHQQWNVMARSKSLQMHLSEGQGCYLDLDLKILEV